ncbi:MAG: T9SS type A sorting domain-containing protein, partial [Bacteroidota bacterium]
CWKYDAINDNWIQKADFAGTPRSNCVAFTLNGKGIVGLGFDTAFQFRNDFMQYDTATDSWSPFDSLPAAARSGAVAFTFPTRAYVGFGYDSLYLKDTYYYAALNDQVSETVTVPIEVSVYPNPASSYFSIQCSFPLTEKYFFTLFDLSGKIQRKFLLNNKVRTTDCNTSALNTGIYFYRIKSENKTVTVGKLEVIK